MGMQPDNELRAMVRLWCEEARQRKLEPEQFLVVIKAQFAKLPDMRRGDVDGSERRKIAERIVTMCIEEYFAPL